MRAHPVAALFPSLEGADFDQFVADIREHGLREPIKTWNGVLIDGRNRERACKAAGIEPRHKEIKFADEYEAIAYIISENLHRRHLDTGQRAMVGRNCARASLLPRSNARKRPVATRSPPRQNRSP